MIGITGSYGKTSAKNFLHALLSVKYNVLMTPESYNTTMGWCAPSREQLRPSHRFSLPKWGENPGDIREICDLVHPRYGMIALPLGAAFETFGTVENIIRTKFELADALPPEGRAFSTMTISISEGGRIVTFPPSPMGGGDAGAMYSTASGYRRGCGGSFSPSRRRAGKPGVHHPSRWAFTISKSRGLHCRRPHPGPPTLEDWSIRCGCSPVPHRLQLLPTAISTTPIIPIAGFRAALDAQPVFEGQRVLVTPGMVELGQRQGGAEPAGGPTRRRAAIIRLVGK